MFINTSDRLIATRAKGKRKKYFIMLNINESAMGFLQFNLVYKSKNDSSRIKYYEQSSENIFLEYFKA
jgi:hypothetical protein